MKDEILSEIRAHVFRDVSAKVSGMLDKYRSQIEETSKLSDQTPLNVELLRDQIDHLMKAMMMISKVPANSDGAMMARGIAEEAISAASSIDD